MKQYNFLIGPTDTDSISFCKPDMSPFSEQELETLLNEINELSPEFIEWEDDGYYKSCVALKAKNYVLYDGEKKTVKGSAFKTSSKEPAMKEMMEKVVEAMLSDNLDSLVDIYHSYVREACNVQDISRWCQKKSASEAVLNCKGYEKINPEKLEIMKKNKEIRSNEINVWDAIKMEELVQQGDKFYVYPAILTSEIERTEKILKSGKISVKEKMIETYGLRQPKHWNGKDQDVNQLLSRVYATLEIFSTVLDMTKFIDYSGVKKKPELEKLLSQVK